MDNTPKPSKANPRLGANPLSVLVFGWLMPTLWKSFKQGFGPKDQSMALPWDKAEKVGDMLEKNWINELHKSKQQNRKPKLSKAIFKTFWVANFTNGLLQLCMIIIKSFIPVLLIYYVMHFDVGSNSSLQEACVMAAGLTIASLVCAFMQHHGEFRQICTGMRIRVACTSLVYRKIHRLSRASAAKIAAGQLINLLSNDVSRYDLMLLFVNFIWIFPALIGLSCYLMYTRVGYASFIGISAIVLQSLPFQQILAVWTKRYRSRVAEKTDERIKLMNELISGIQVIKMYAWEIPFVKLVSVIRKLEIRLVRLSLYVRGIYMLFFVLIEKTTLFITLVSCIFLEEDISAGNVFAMTVFFNILQLNVSIFLPIGIASLSEALVSTNRIQEFLELPEIDNEATRGIMEKNIKITLNKEKIPESFLQETKIHDGNIVLNNVNANWTDDADTLKNISLNLPQGKFCAVIGAVGSGKSSLLQLLVGELPVKSGTCHVGGDVSYACQEPWLFNGTIRSNILFGLPYERDRYKEVVKKCALERDFELFPREDHTVVGERGASLSGGQRARINLARSVYRQADIYLLDDPLSAVDAPVGKQLVNNCLGKAGYLAKKTRVVATHQLHILQETDWIIVLSNGTIESQGTYEDLIQSESNFFSLLAQDDEHKQDEDLGKPRTSVTLRERLTSVCSSVNTATDEVMESPLPEEEEQVSGTTKAIVYWKFFRAGTKPFGLFLMFMLTIISQVATSGTDYWVNFWTQQEALKTIHASDPTAQAPILSTYNCIYIYAALLAAYLFLIPLRTGLFFKICSKSSENLHNEMFSSVLTAPMRFFDLNPTGRILNRFSKDMGVNDELLPKSLAEALQAVIVIIGILLMMVIVNYILIIPVLIISLLFFIFIRVYMSSAVDLRRAESIARSPIYSYVTSSFYGIATIRSCDKSSELINEFDTLQDVHSSCWHLSIAAQTLLGLTLDMVIILLVLAVSFSYIIMEIYDYGPIISGDVGFVTATALMLTDLAQYGARQVTDAINYMTSVERILQYRDLEQEPKIETQPPPNWPSKGEIEFQSTDLFYSPAEPPTLKNLSFTIEAGWKVGVVGRTGAGKSSLISAIFRLYPVDGQIIIDSLETGNICLQSLRSKISIIPQNPVLFSATIRYNLDPFEQFDDYTLWKALEDVELKSSVDSLDFKVTAGGNNFSVGQRQLVCLARAILRDSKILLLDEATANVDQQTDALIQKTIRSTFRSCTVLTIAHRLNTVMDSDRILVLDAGSIKEYGVPYDLLRIPNGALWRLAIGTGPINYELLLKIAKEALPSIAESNESVLEEDTEIFLPENNKDSNIENSQTRL